MGNENNKIPVAVLGATGAVGQRFVQLLSGHPWFSLQALAASERSVGKPYQESCRWLLDTPMPPEVAELVIQPVKPELDAKMVFSALPVELAREAEPSFARAGYAVCSNSSAFRLEADVPLIIPEVNADHLALLECQQERRGWKGLLVVSPNCTTTGIAIPLKPIHQAFGIRRMVAVSMQAVSGAGYPGLPFLDIQNNVIPYIDGEEEKIEKETRVLLGAVQAGKRLEADFVVSAQANRVPVADGHTVCLSLELDRKATVEELRHTLRAYAGPVLTPALPSQPEKPLAVNDGTGRPQPRLDGAAGNGMQVTVGRIRPCPVLDVRLVSVVHNTLRGAAGGAILNAELLAAKGYLE